MTRLCIAASPVERSLLSIASFYGAKDVAAQLLARGANANFASRDDSMTPLHMAAAGNTLYTVEIIRLLLFHGANKESVDKLGRQPVELLPMNCQQRQPLPQQLHMPMLSEMQLKELTFEDTGVVVVS